MSSQSKGWFVHVNKSNPLCTTTTTLIYFKDHLSWFDCVVWVKRENMAYYSWMHFYRRLESRADEVWIAVSEVSLPTRTHQVGHLFQSSVTNQRSCSYITNHSRGLDFGGKPLRFRQKLDSFVLFCTLCRCAAETKCYFHTYPSYSYSRYIGVLFLLHQLLLLHSSNVTANASLRYGH